MVARESGLTAANTFRHLHIMRGANLIESHKKGLYVIYQIVDPAVCGFVRSMGATLGSPGLQGCGWRGVRGAR